MTQVLHRALIVDDEPNLRKATARAMTAHSFCCDTAQDGEEAIKLYNENRHDLVVTDLRMPKRHGHSLILELLQDQDPPRIVVLTGVANQRLREDLLARGISEIYNKPIDFQIFAATMLSLLDPMGWAMPIDARNQVRVGDQRHPLVRQIESALEIFSLCVPEELDQEFVAVADEMSDPQPNLLQFLEHLSQQRTPYNERRKMVRIPVFSTAMAVPVDKDFRATDKAFTVNFNDMSEGGACLLHTRPVEAEYLALRWCSLISPRSHLKAVLRVMRCNPLGPFYEIAGQFVMRD